MVIKMAFVLDLFNYSSVCKQAIRCRLWVEAWLVARTRVRSKNNIIRPRHGAVGKQNPRNWMRSLIKGRGKPEYVTVEHNVLTFGKEGLFEDVICMSLSLWAITDRYGRCSLPFLLTGILFDYAGVLEAW